jgi:predicted ATPase/DNA-binding winged helix-turn-helix (wHTH) protein
MQAGSAKTMDRTQPQSPGTNGRRWRFADAVLDEQARELRVRGERVAIDRKPFDVLAYLVQHASQVVTKDQLAHACWPGRFLSDSVLARTLSRVRAALGDQEQRLVATVHGVGWRLAVAVQPETEAAAPAAPRIGNLPAPLTTLVGRDAPLQAAIRMLRGKDARLLTLIGCGGIGKTRLAIGIAAELARDFAHGVFFVDLTPATAADQFAAAIAQVLRVRESGTQPVLEGLKEHLRHRQLLLVLDNFEQLIVAAPQLATLLAEASAIRAIATSREPLHIRGEQLLEVPALALPARGPVPPADLLGAYSAIELFVQRAQMVKADFSLTAANAADIAGICQRLDGLPLAIELAAARSRLFAPAALLEGLGHRFELLQDGARDLPDRQRTLWATIDWSHQLLEPNERAVLRRASVFAGGFTLEAAQAVAVGSGVGESDVFHLLARLVDKSLLHYEDQGLPGRYRMLETIREYALQRLDESDDRADTRKRHLEWCLRFAEASEAHLWMFLPDARMRTWTARMDLGLDNVRVALAWSREHAPATGLQLAATLHWFWFERGYISEARQWLHELLVRATEAPDTVRAQALVAAANLAVEQGGSDAARKELFGQARAALQQSFAIFQARGDKSWMAYVLSSLASLAVTESGDAVEAERHVRQGLALAREAGDRWLISYLTHFAGRGAYFAQDLAGAAAAFEESVAAARAIGGHSVGEGYGLYWLGRIVRTQGDLARAGAWQREALALFQVAGNVQGMANVLTALGGLAELSGDARRAVLVLSAVAAWRADKKVYLEPDLDAEHARHLAAAQGRMDAAAFIDANSAGRALDPEQAVLVAVGQS